MTEIGDTLQLSAVGLSSRRRLNKGFWPVATLSLGLHLGAFGVAVWNARSTPQRAQIERAIPVELVKLGKLRDPKLLPRKVEPVAAPPPAEDGVALETKPSDPKKEPAEKKPKKDPEMSAAAKRMLDQSSKLDKALSKLKPEEDEGSPDGDVGGTTTDPTNAAKGYLADVSRAIHQAYRLPEAIPPSQRAFLKARVVLYIEANGKISRYEFVEKHPNALFTGALETCLRSLTLPAPPPAQAKAMRESGIEVVFRP